MGHLYISIICGIFIYKRDMWDIYMQARYVGYLLDGIFRQFDCLIDKHFLFYLGIFE